jgi:hypothetical protein
LSCMLIGMGVLHLLLTPYGGSCDGRCIRQTSSVHGRRLLTPDRRTTSGLRFLGGRHRRPGAALRP